MEGKKGVIRENQRARPSSFTLFTKFKRLGALRVRGMTSSGIHYWCEVLKNNPQTKKMEWVCYDDTSTELIVSDKTLYYEALDMSIVEYANKETGDFEDPIGCVTSFDVLKRLIHFVRPNNFPPEIINALPRHVIYIVHGLHGKYQEIRKF